MVADLILPFDGSTYSDDFERVTDPVNITSSPMPHGGLAWGAGPIGGVGTGAIHCTGGAARTAGSGTAVMIAFSAPATSDLTLFSRWRTLTSVETVGPAFSVQNANNFYYVAARTTGWRIWRYNSTTATDAAITQTVHTNVLPASGAEPIVTKVGDQLTVTFNGVLSLSATLDADMVANNRFGMVLTGLDTSTIEEIAAYPG